MRLRQILYLLRLPDADLIGVTTNYSVSVIRAEVARRIISAHRASHPDYPDVPVIAGSSRPLERTGSTL
jgi:inosine-uridine nucleoside N-ribohydrolase